MAVTRYYNPETDSWELIGVGVQGPRGGPGDPGPEGDPGPPGTQIYYTQDPPAGANLGDMWIDRNGFQPVERVQQGLLSERPTAEPAIINMLFWATDEDQMYYCDGTAWQEVVDGSAYVSSDPLRVERSAKDANGVFTTIEWFRQDGTKDSQSVLSGGTSPEYTTRTVTEYEADGTTVKRTTAYTLTYDVDGDLTTEVFV